MKQQSHEDTGNREDLSIEPSSCFSDFLDSVESVECVSMLENSIICCHFNSFRISILVFCKNEKY